jgi:tetraprenyl-beta-curcumene synthase
MATDDEARRSRSTTHEQDAEGRRACERNVQPPRVRERLALAVVFVRAAASYWLVVFPRVCRELRRWRRRAALIPDPTLRRRAFEALEKRSNVEGAAAFAAPLCGWRRREPVRALVAFQLAYNYLDALAEQPSAHACLNARRLHEALFAAVGCDCARDDYYEFHAQSQDGGYLAALLDGCRAALAALPSYACAAESLRTCVARIVAFQSLSQAGRRDLEHWTLEQPLEGELEWWEVAAGAGSSLGVHALIAAAGQTLSADDVLALDAAYFPTIGALHSLLDSVVDTVEDAASAQLSLIGCYAGTSAAATRMGALAARSAERARALPAARAHTLLLVAMACSYLSSPSSLVPEASEISNAVREQLGPLAVPVLLVFRARASLGRLARSFPGRGLRTKPAHGVLLGDCERSADAGAA